MNASDKEILKQSITEDDNKAQIVNKNGDTLTCGYDGKGNISKIRENGVELISYQYDGQAITYDEIGNPLQYRDGINFTRDNGRTLATYQSKGV